MKEYGGYFELELNQGKEYHSQAVRLNSARHCLSHLLRNRQPSKIYLPKYVCNSVIKPVLDSGIEYAFYSVDQRLEVLDSPVLKDGELLLYVNYFGLKSGYIKKLFDRYSQNLIIDNAQAFFQRPLFGLDTYYSPRKFLGVVDGGYVYCQTDAHEGYDLDDSTNNMLHLLGRLENTASDYYTEYRNAETKIARSPTLKMSTLTAKILDSIDYEFVRNRRINNYNFLKNHLYSVNTLESELLDVDFETHKTAPMVYPFLPKQKIKKSDLHNKNIYVATYWVDALERSELTQFELDLINDVIFIPIDQRINEDGMNEILNVIKDLL